MGPLWVKLAKSLGSGPIIYFLDSVKGKEHASFDNAEFSIQRMKNSFVCKLRSWSKVSVDVDPLSLFSFIDWLNSK